MRFNGNYNDDFDDLLWAIRDIIGMHDLNGKDLEKETFVLSRDDVGKIQTKLCDLLTLYEDLAQEADSKDDEIDDLQDRVDRAYDNIPDSIGDMLNGSYLDVGTVMELEETITAVLKKHGY